MIFLTFIAPLTGSILVIAFALNFIMTRPPRKISAVPKVAFPEAGVCQCNDALCYHTATGCSIANCGCKVFIPSTADDNIMTTLVEGHLSSLLMQANVEISSAKKLKIEAADAKQRYETLNKRY